MFVSKKLRQLIISSLKTLFGRDDLRSSNLFFSMDAIGLYGSMISTFGSPPSETLRFESKTNGDGAQTPYRFTLAKYAIIIPISLYIEGKITIIEPYSYMATLSASETIIMGTWRDASNALMSINMHLTNTQLAINGTNRRLYGNIHLWR